MMNWTYGYDGMMGAFGFGGFLFMIAWWVVVIYAVVWVIRQMTNGGVHHEKKHHAFAMDILKERYAKGEINKQEFEEKKKDLIG